MAALVQGPPYSGEWTLDTRFHCQAWQWPWKPGSTVKPQPQFLEWPWKPGSTVNPHPHSDPGNQVQLWTPTPTVTLETRFNCETPASVPHSDPGNQVPRCACGNFNWIYKFSRKRCWWTVFNLWSFMMIWLWTQCWKPSLKLCIFLPMISFQNSLHKFLGLGSETKIGKSYAIMYLFGRGPIFFGEGSHGISNSDRQKTQ